MKNYYQLTKPGIIYGNLLTAAGGFLLAANGSINVWLLLATLSGTALIIASGCVFNNYIDRGIDKKMLRTRKRAIVSGLITARSAIIYGTALGLLGLLILTLWTNILVVAIGVAAWFFYVVIYGVAKRRSVHGTLVGTIPGAAAPLAGYVAVTNHFDLGSLLIFLILVTWQMPHFYAISLYRLKDYKASGLPVLPVKKGVQNTKIQIISYTAAFIIAILLFSALGYGGHIYVVVMGLLGLRWLWLGVKGFDAGVDDTLWARKMFMLSLIIITSHSIMLSLSAWLPVEIVFSLSTLLLIHVTSALASLVYATYVFISPEKSHFLIAYVLAALTLATGIYLVWSTGTHLLEACTTGLIYTAIVAFVMTIARRRLNGLKSSSE